MVKFNQNAFLIPYTYLNTDLRKKVKSDFEKDFSKLMNNAIFEKTKENMRKHRDTKLVTTERRRNYSVLESSYHTTKFFSNKNEKNAETFEETCLFRTFNTRIK